MAFHVFVEGATDDTPAGVERLAAAIAKHYGLPAADLLARLQRGRFRVKGNIDRTLADKYCRDLERLGARCIVEAATAENSQRTTPIPFPAVRPATPPVGVPTAPPARPSTPPSALSGIAAKPAPPPSASGQYQSGLAAAFAPSEAPASLGALDSENVSFSLASVDGADEQAAAPAGGFEPPAASMSASIGPPPEKATAAKGKPEKPKDVPLDLFAPPDAQDAQLAVNIADDDVPRRKSEPAIPVPAEATAAAAPAMRRSQPSLQTPGVPVGVPASSKLGPLADLRVRFAAGVVIAILVGFIPAHVVASMREGSYKDIDNKVIAAQQMADTPETYAQLDRLRADQLERKRNEQRSTAIMALAIWGLVGGAVAFGWFKKVPWERFE